MTGLSQKVTNHSRLVNHKMQFTIPAAWEAWNPWRNWQMKGTASNKKHLYSFGPWNLVKWRLFFFFNPCNFAGKTSWILCGVFQAVVCELPEWCKDDRIRLTKRSLKSSSVPCDRFDPSIFCITGFLRKNWAARTNAKIAVDTLGLPFSLRSLESRGLSFIGKTWGKHLLQLVNSQQLAMWSVCRRGPLGGGCVRHEESARLEFLHPVV